jgi:hypothetical protein
MRDSITAANAAKHDVLKMIGMLNQTYFGEDYDDEAKAKMLQGRTAEIQRFIASLGELTEYQKDYIFSLFEMAEFLGADSEADLKTWQPSLVSGKWV